MICKTIIKYLILQKLFADERVWLHIEITINGLAANVHLVGQSEEWHDKLQDRLLSWDHDMEIVENIKTIFGKIFAHFFLLLPKNL